MSAHTSHRGLVVGVDGSAASEVAVRWAARDAGRRHAPLTLVHVMAGTAGTWMALPPAGLGQRLEEDARRMLDAAVQIARQSATGDQLREIKTEIFFSATVPTLVELSKEAEIVVVGRHGRGRLHRLIGSVASGVVRHGHCPVALVHEDVPTVDRKEAPVLVGVDGSPASESAIAIAFDEASRRGVGLVALHAWSDVSAFAFMGRDWPRTQSAAEEVLAERLAGWNEQYPDVAVRRIVVCDEPASHVVEESKSAQLVVVGTRGRGGFAGLLLGSVSAAVVEGVRIPVIVARHS